MKLFLVNFKNYSEGLGKSGVRILHTMEKVAKEYPEVRFIASPSLIFLRSMVKKAKRVKIYAQHVDPVQLGSFTGHIPPEVVHTIGADGTLVNHSEKRMDLEKIKEAITLSQEQGLTVCACAPTPEIAGKIAEEGPNYLAYEPPELIGTDTSVSEAKPQLLLESVRSIKKRSDGKVLPLCGAGIKKALDVKKGLELGVEGILIASGIVKAENPYKKLKELAEPMVEFKS
ncbi:MAG: triose-phosphate isomerase [Candidatus Korarchaeota archaeon]|nr:triose-phosphate isomerase [Candidatus Korarchaeota archaeon]NIU84158.1 triose-phosphate isomerase [Candidatus Thorarchaeota archaeon]NIW14303.1 triose-phosphate isomerase [Candidatus Thorarchaeota archaeon]NIW52400.1 triose-phosphate isomerase [Candidatus Korarchaeota archaeon]